VADQKIDVQELLKTWERIGPLTADPAAQTPEFLEEVSGFVFRLASHLPDLARVHQQHDDMCRAVAFLAENDFEINIRFKSGNFAAQDLAKAYITMARVQGWKPPRECD
jgi:hypothetical protein